MKQLALCITCSMVLSVLVGCGTEPTTKANGSSTKPKPNSGAVEEAPKHELPPVETAFASIDEAMLSVRTSIESSHIKQRQAACAWLVSQGEPSRQKIVELVNSEITQQEPSEPWKDEITYRRVLIRVIPKFGLKGEETLRELIEHENTYFSSKAIESLGLVKPPTKTALDTLIELMQDKEADEMARCVAIQSIKQMGPDAMKVQKDLDKLLMGIRNSTEESDRLRDYAASALKEVNLRTSFND